MYIAYIPSHGIILHYIQNTHGEYHLILFLLYVSVRQHANPWSQTKPSGMDAAGFEPEGGVTVRHDHITMSSSSMGAPEQTPSSLPPILAKANPTPASKLAFVKMETPEALLKLKPICHILFERPSEQKASPMYYKDL